MLNHVVISKSAQRDVNKAPTPSSPRRREPPKSGSRRPGGVEGKEFGTLLHRKGLHEAILAQSSSVSATARSLGGEPRLAATTAAKDRLAGAHAEAALRRLPLRRSAM